MRYLGMAGAVAVARRSGAARVAKCARDFYFICIYIFVQVDKKLSLNGQIVEGLCQKVFLAMCRTVMISHCLTR